MQLKIETAKGEETFFDFLMVAEETFEDQQEGQVAGNSGNADGDGDGLWCDFAKVVTLYKCRLMHIPLLRRCYNL